MSIKESFSEEQWDLLNSTPSLVGFAVATAGFSGIMGTAKESMANIRSIMEGGKKYPNNELIQAIAPDSSDYTTAKERASYQKNLVSEKLKANGAKSGAEVKALTISELGKLITLLEEKTPEQATAYRNWLLEIANNVATAAKEGGFLGFGGTRVSEAEQLVLGELNRILQTEVA